ncbi:MAG: hypothetical protein ABMB14_31195, partial [Myxococcota bacterium]
DEPEPPRDVADHGALAPAAGDRGTWVVWAAGLPPLAVLTNLAVPDALLLTAWALGLAGAIRGGRGWWVAGLCGGLASLAKYTGIGLVPLLILGADPAERRTADPWLGLALAAALVAPNLGWNAVHDGVTLRFQLGEGLLNAHPPGLGGVVVQLVDQCLVAGPIAAAAAVGWFARTTSGWASAPRVDRLCLATSLPLAVGFALAAIGGPPEAHWPAPMWIGIGLGLSRAAGRLHRAGSLGAALGAVVSVAIAVHGVHPLVRWPGDPGVRLTEGEVLGAEVARWVVPAVAGDEPRYPVFTERYQEAALLRWTTGLDVHVLPGCGRRSQDDLDAGRADAVLADAVLAATLPDRVWFVRPATSGPPRCLLDRYPILDGPHPIRTVDRFDRRVGPWDLFGAAR